MGRGVTRPRGQAAQSARDSLPRTYPDTNHVKSSLGHSGSMPKAQHALRYRAVPSLLRVLRKRRTCPAVWGSCCASRGIMGLQLRNGEPQGRHRGVCGLVHGLRRQAPGCPQAAPQILNTWAEGDTGQRRRPGCQSSRIGTESEVFSCAMPSPASAPPGTRPTWGASREGTPRTGNPVMAPNLNPPGVPSSPWHEKASFPGNHTHFRFRA